MTSSATLIKSRTLGRAGAGAGAPTPPAHTLEDEASAPDARQPRRRLPLPLLALLGALAAAVYALVIEKMRFGPPLVMFALGGMTLALAGAALVRVIDPLTGDGGAASSGASRSGRRKRELEREKQLVLKAIKEVELDYQMRKVAERDYREMVERYRTRAMRLMSEIEAGDDFRSLIEKELAMRLKLDAGRPAPSEPSKSAGSPGEAITRNLAEEARQAMATLSPDEGKALRERAAADDNVGAGDAERPGCVDCGTVNDHDARFCKKCGAKLSSS